MMADLKLIVAAVALPAVLSGCTIFASASPDWDARFGDSNRVMQAQQLIDPQAPTRNGQTVPATDGRNVRDAMDRHGESYRSPPPSTVTNISIGGG